MRTLRFLRSWTRGSLGTLGVARCGEREVELRAEGEGLPATVFAPPGAVTGSHPAWVALHGVTRPGRSHAGLTRFCRAMAASGAVIVVPEIREWTDLRLAPRRTVPVVRAAVEWLGEHGSRSGGRPGLVGFSFGAPQALRTAADPSLRGRIGGVAGFGGYFDVHRTVRFQLTGRHEWKGMTHRLDPDPYGRWIMAANHITDVPGYEGAGDVAQALRTLAAFAGDEQIPSDSSRMNRFRAELRTEVPPERAELFDLLAEGPSPAEDAAARPGGSTARLGASGPGASAAGLEAVGSDAPPLDAGTSGSPDPRLAKLEVLAEGLAEAALEMEPHLDVRSCLQAVECPVELVHGRFDRLIPYTESLRLAERIAANAPVHLTATVTVTDLFAHSRGSALGKGPRTAMEGWRFFSALRRVLGMV